MLKITIDPFEDVENLDELVSLSYYVKREHRILKKTDSYGVIHQNLEDLRNKHKLIIFRAFLGSQLRGFLLLLIDTPKFGLPWDWHPIIYPGKNEGSIAEDLLKNCIEFAKKQDITRLEVCFSIENKAQEKLYLKQLKSYERLGFYALAEEANMELILDKYISKPVKLPDNCTIEILGLRYQEELPQIAYHVFNESQDQMFLDLGEDEKWVMCKKYFDLNESIIQDASYVLKKDGEIIGFSIVKANGYEAVLNSVGIVSKYRNKGLAKSLILLSLNALAKTRFTRIVLDVTKKNTPAYNLYIKLGFKLKLSTLIYALNC